MRAIGVELANSRVHGQQQMGGVDWLSWGPFDHLCADRYFVGGNGKKYIYCRLAAGVLDCIGGDFVVDVFPGKV